MERKTLIDFYNYVTNNNDGKSSTHEIFTFNDEYIDHIEENNSKLEKQIRVLKGVLSDHYDRDYIEKLIKVV